MTRPRTFAPTPEARARARPADHPPVPAARIGVVLANLGTPDATDYWSMRRYLNEFLSDRRVIDTPRWNWQPLLQTVILSKRPFTSGANYRKIWNRETDESPLRTITREQTAALAARLRRAPRRPAAWSTSPCATATPRRPSVIERLQAAGCERIVFFPLYPQYSATTTATANDAGLPGADGAALAAGDPHRARLPRPSALHRGAGAVGGGRPTPASAERPDVLVTSYHGMPERYLAEGDPYYCHCQKTTRLLRDRLGPGFERGGRHLPVPLRPGGMAEALHRGGGRPPGAGRASAASRSWRRSSPPTASRRWRRSSEEIRLSFLAAGGENFTYIPCLNAGPAHVDDDGRRSSSASSPAGSEASGAQPSSLGRPTALRPALGRWPAGRTARSDARDTSARRHGRSPSPFGSFSTSSPCAETQLET